MATLITQLTSSNANLHINYFDSVTNQNANFIAQDIRKPGIYSGGYLTPVSNSSFSLSPLTCEIQDSGGSGNQIRLATTATITGITVSNTAPPTLVVLRWTYTANSSANYPSIYTVSQGAQLATDLVIGTAAYSGSTLSADYGVTYPSYLRSDPQNILDLALKVESTANFPYAMTSGVMLRYGRVSYGSSTFSIPTQTVSVTASIGTPTYYQIVLLQVSSSGVVSTSLSPYGTAVPSSPTPPSYNNLLTLAEITVQYTGGIYYITAMKDVRCFNNFSPIPVATSTILASVYPIGALYTETTGVNPNTTFGFGTWSAFGAGRALFGYSAGDPNFGTALGTGGSANHTNTINELAPHTHTVVAQYNPGSGAAGSGTSGGNTTLTTNSTGNGAAYSILNPYITVYFWLRTA